MLDTKTWPGVLEQGLWCEASTQETMILVTYWGGGVEQASNPEQRHSNDNGSQVSYYGGRETNTEGAKM